MGEDIQLPRGSEFARAMNVVQIVKILKNLGIERMQSFTPGQPLLFVLPDSVRGDEGAYAYLLPRERPCVARVDQPTKLIDEGSTATLMNDGGRVDYYALNEDGKFFHVKTSTRKAGYVVMDKYLYQTNDQFFPPQLQVHNT